MQKDTFELIPFDFKGAAIRMVKDRSGEPWWVLIDVAKALGYTSVYMAKKHLKSRHLITLSKREVNPNGALERGGGGFITLINEYGIMRLALRSRLPRAEEFQEQVEILLVALHRGTVGLIKLELREATAHIAWLEAKEDRLELEKEELEQDMRGNAKLLEYYRRKK